MFEGALRIPIDPEQACLPRPDGPGFVDARGLPVEGTAVTTMSSGDRSLHRVLNGVNLCARSQGGVVLDEDDGRIVEMPPGSWLVLAARDQSTVQRLEVRAGTGGPRATPRYDWFVNGERRSFDDQARAWRDTMLESVAIHTAIWTARAGQARIQAEWARIRAEEVAQTRAEEVLLRGEMARIQAEAAAARGEAAALRGAEVALRAQEARMGRELEAQLARILADVDQALARLRERQPEGRLQEQITELAELHERLRFELHEQLGEQFQEQREARREMTEARVAELRTRESVESQARLAEVLAEVNERIQAMQAETLARTEELWAQRADPEMAERIREIEGRMDVEATEARIAELRERLAEVDGRLLELIARVR